VDEYKSRLSAYLSDMVREELEKYDGGFTDEWNDQRKKNAEVLGYKLSGKSDIKEGATEFWQDMFRPGNIPNKYINQLIKKKGELPSKSHIKSIYKDNGNPSSSQLSKAFKQLAKEKYIRKQGSMWKWESGFAWRTGTELESVNEGFTKYHIRLTDTPGWYGVWDKKGKQKFEGDRRFVTKHLKKLKTRMGNYQLKSLIDVATKRKGKDITFDVVESINEAIKPQGYSQLNTMAKHAGIYIRDLLKALRKQDDNAVIREVHFLAAQFTTMEKMLKDKKWNAKYSESVNEAGMGILTTDQSDVLQGIVLRNKNKNLKAILKIVLKDPMFKGVDKKELLGYIDGARQFVKYMKSHPMESVNEDRDYKAEYKKYGSSTKAKKYRAELNQYNRKKGTYGNNDGKDASHKGGKIVGFEKESTNRGRREKSRLKKEDIREDIGLDVYLGGIIKAMRKSRLKPKTAKVMKHGFSKSKDKIGFFIDVEKREIEGKKLWTLQFEVDRDGYLWYLSAPRDIKIGKWADTSQLVRGFKKLDRLPGFGQDAIFKRRR